MKIYIKSSQEVDDLEAKIASLEHDIDKGLYEDEDELEELEKRLARYDRELEEARARESQDFARNKIASIEDRIALLEDRLSDDDLDEDERIDLQLELNELQDELNFAWQDDEAEYNYARETQEFNPDGSLKWY